MITTLISLRQSLILAMVGACTFVTCAIQAVNFPSTVNLLASQRLRCFHCSTGNEARGESLLPVAAAREPWKIGRRPVAGWAIGLLSTIRRNRSPAPPGKGLEMFKAGSNRTDPAPPTARRARWWQQFAARFLRSNGAAISPMFALMLIPISGSIAFAVEQGGFYYVQRSAQNAADAAAIAAAINNSATGSTYLAEARAAARPYGYVDDEGDVTVSAEPVDCPDDTGTCYKAKITTVFPVVFARVVGFSGDRASGQTIAATAIARTAGSGGPEVACMWSLSTGSDSFTTHGAPNADLTGCSVMSSGDMTCTGHNLLATYGIAAGSNGPSNQCGITAVPDFDVPNDNAFRDLAVENNLAAAKASCTSFPQFPAKPKDPALPSTNLLYGDKSWSGNQVLCGDVQLTNDVTITGGGAATVIISNGRLNLNGHTIRTDDGTEATIVFTGTNSKDYYHFPMGSGTIDIEAPKEGGWSGVAIYQDPLLTQNVDLSYAGNNPAWQITGLVYLPNALAQFNGIVNKSSNGESCFILIAYRLKLQGTAEIIANNDNCAKAGLDDPPGATVGPPTPVKLVS